MMALPKDLLIENVSDTALWVAYYRGLETDKANALFKDPFAKILAGEKGRKIAESMRLISPYTNWNVTIRTWIIDQYIQDFVEQGVDTVVNLGAGLDTRPYRLNLPKSLRWIEVDYSHMIEYKTKVLEKEISNVRLERISLDLSSRNERQKLFSTINQESKKVLVLTEGVIIYLNEKSVSELAEDLSAQNHFQFWIAEYLSKEIYRYFQGGRRAKKMKNAPFQFSPKHWFEFFEKFSWMPNKIRYLPEEGLRLHRPMPLPWWAKFLIPFMSPKKKKFFLQQMAYVVFEKK